MRKTSATNRRNFQYKYYRIDDTHSLAVPAGRCRCGKITDMYCFKCYKYICENHLFTDGAENYCKDCKPEKARELRMNEKRKIRKAKLDLNF